MFEKVINLIEQYVIEYGVYTLELKQQGLNFYK